MKTKSDISLQDQLAAARLELNNTPENLRHLFTNGTRAEQMFLEAQKTAVIRLQLQSDGRPDHVINAGSNVLSEARGAVLADLPRLAAMVDALNHSDTFAEAKATCQPLVDRIAELEAEILAEKHAEALRLQDIENRKREATAAALAKVEKDFSTA